MSDASPLYQGRRDIDDAQGVTTFIIVSPGLSKQTQKISALLKIAFAQNYQIISLNYCSKPIDQGACTVRWFKCSSRVA